MINSRKYKVAQRCHPEFYWDEGSVFIREKRDPRLNDARQNDIVGLAVGQASTVVGMTRTSRRGIYYLDIGTYLD